MLLFTTLSPSQIMEDSQSVSNLNISFGGQTLSIKDFGLAHYERHMYDLGFISHFQIFTKFVQLLWLTESTHSIAINS